MYPLSSKIFLPERMEEEATFQIFLYKNFKNSTADLDTIRRDGTKKYFGEIRLFLKLKTLG